MEKKKAYQNAFFKAAILKRAADELVKLSTPDDTKKSYNTMPIMIVTGKDGRWTFDDREEFLSEYKVESSALFVRRLSGYQLPDYHFQLSFNSSRFYGSSTEIGVEAASRREIETVFNIFEESVADSKLPEPVEIAEPPVVFIGHGGSKLWRNLKDHLQDKHEYKSKLTKLGLGQGTR